MGDRSEAASPRAWQRMLSGRRLDLLAPDPADIEIEDIAHGLARVARWNGQTRGRHALSVAQHSVSVEAAMTARTPGLARHWQLAALLHDAPEYVIGDLISPFKAMVGPHYKAIEARLQAAIHVRFGLPEELPAAIKAAIKAADRAVAYREAVALAGFAPAEAAALFSDPASPPPPSAAGHATEPPWPAELAAVRFLDRFAALHTPGSSS